MASPDLPRIGTDETDGSDGFPHMESLDALLAIPDPVWDDNDDESGLGPREGSGVASFDTLLTKCKEASDDVKAEIAALEREMADQADDEAYWGRLYYVMNRDYALHNEYMANPNRELDEHGDPVVSEAEALRLQEAHDVPRAGKGADADDDDNDDAGLGIEKILAKRQAHNVVYYQVRWKEHRAVTWERADDILAARTLLTAFDGYLRNKASGKGPSDHPRLSRRERRERREAKAAAEVDAVGSTPHAVTAAPPPPRPPPEPSTTYDAVLVTKLVADLDAKLQDAEKNCTAAAVADWPATAQAQLTAVYNEMVLEFADTAKGYMQTYNGRAGEEALAAIPPGDNVPSYFANVGGESVWRRKMLSMLGLRNLVTYGRAIFREMRAKQFAGNPTVYKGDEGPHKMRRVTGNVVDLDTTVLRCSDRLTMNAINEWNARTGQPRHANTCEFAASQQARDIAATAAITLLEKFNADFKLTKTKEAMAGRRTDPADINAADIPIARTNTDRGRWPLWRYRNVGVDSYHANVPSLDDVNGALLRAPLQCVKGYLTAKRCGELNKFYEDCVVDSCFNMKWRAIEDFNAQYARRGTIKEILERTQHDHQTEFSDIMDDDDAENTKEVAAMLKHIGSTMGTDKGGRLRRITAADVKKWIDDPAAEL